MHVVSRSPGAMIKDFGLTASFDDETPQFLALKVSSRVHSKK